MQVSLWFDYWLPIGPIHSIFGDHIIEATGLHRNATVAAIIRHGQWRWPWTSSAELQGLKQLIFDQPQPRSVEQDAVIWCPDNAGKFSIKSAWDSIRTHKEMVEWYNLIWFTGRIPKTAFCLWLAVKEKLGTQDRLFPNDPNMTCFFCRHSTEDHNHLFFRCSATSQIWKNIQHQDGFSTPSIDWSHLIGWMSKEWKGSSLQTVSWKLSLAASVYNIWLELNSRLHNSRANNVAWITGKIIYMVKLRLSVLKGFQDTVDNRATQSRWNLPPSIFHTL